MTTDVVPFTADALEQYTDPGQFVELALDRAKTWLVQALEHGDIEGIVELKSQAEAIRTYTVQKQLAKDTVLSATEIIRRAEQGLGVAVKKGQAEGTVGRRGRNGREDALAVVHPLSSANIFNGNADREDSYILAEAPPEQFEAAIAEAKAEGNLSRANVVAKIKGESPRPRTSDRDPIHHKAPRMNSDRIIQETVYALEGLTSTLKYVNVAELDIDKLGGWLTSLKASLKLLNSTMKEMTRAQN